MQKSQMIRTGNVTMKPRVELTRPAPAPEPAYIGFDSTKAEPKKCWPRRPCSDADVRRAGTVYLNGSRSVSLGDGCGWAKAHIDDPDGDDLSDIYPGEARTHHAYDGRATRPDYY